MDWLWPVWMGTLSAPLFTGAPSTRTSPPSADVGVTLTKLVPDAAVAVYSVTEDRNDGLSVAAA